MIPENSIFEEDLDTEENEEQVSLKSEPWKTFRIDFNTGHINGTIGEEEALKQAVTLMLNTHRYENEIFSWNYGLDINDLIGKDISYVMPMVKKRIRETLLQDDRIEDITDFDISIKEKSKLLISFVLVEKRGDEIYIEGEVNANV